MPSVSLVGTSDTGTVTLSGSVPCSTPETGSLLVAWWTGLVPYDKPAGDPSPVVADFFSSPYGGFTLAPGYSCWTSGPFIQGHAGWFKVSGINCAAGLQVVGIIEAHVITSDLASGAELSFTVAGVERFAMNVYNIVGAASPGLFPAHAGVSSIGSGSDPWVVSIGAAPVGGSMFVPAWAVGFVSPAVCCPTALALAATAAPSLPPGWDTLEGGADAVYSACFCDFGTPVLSGWLEGAGWILYPPGDSDWMLDFGDAGSRECIPGHVDFAVWIRNNLGLFLYPEGGVPWCDGETGNPADGLRLWQRL